MSYRILRSVVLLAAAVLPLQVAPPATAAALASTIIAVTAGYAHTCALTKGGGVKCWGSNSSGQLGNGLATDSRVPVDVSGLSSGVIAIAAGYGHSCALTSGGAVRCWGDNRSGRLGNGSTTSSSVPVAVQSLSSAVIGISAGRDHTCALASGGGVTCWGQNSSGQLGNGSTTGSRVPVGVSGLSSGVIAIAAGDGYTCALTDARGVKCWGSYDPSPGSGAIDSLVPVDVSALASGIIAIVAGHTYTCALTSSGGVKCWGLNGSGVLGDGSTTDNLTPIDVAGLASGVGAISGGGLHACAIAIGGRVTCWGANGNGQLGNGLATDSSVPVDVSGLPSGVSAITAGEYHSCAVTSSGGVKCWGFNSRGQLGNGTTTDSPVPVDVIFSSQGLPQTDMADPGAHEGRADPPLFPLLAGLGAGIAMLMRRRQPRTGPR